MKNFLKNKEPYKQDTTSKKRTIHIVVLAGRVTLWGGGGAGVVQTGAVTAGGDDLLPQELHHLLGGGHIYRRLTLTVGLQGVSSMLQKQLNQLTQK